MPTLSLNPKSANIIEGDFTRSKDWVYDLIKGNGILSEDDWLIFESNGFEVFVDFDLCVIGDPYMVSSSDLTPDYVEDGIESIEIVVKNVEIDGYLVLLTDELKEKLSNLIEKNI